MYGTKSMECCCHHHSWIPSLMHIFHPIWLTDMGVNHPNSTIYVPVINFVCINVSFSIPHNWQLWNSPFTVCFSYQKPSVNCALLWVFFALSVGHKVCCPWRSKCVFSALTINVALCQFVAVCNTNWNLTEVHTWLYMTIVTKGISWFCIQMCVA
jgi:hypothetical protein